MDPDFNTMLIILFSFIKSRAAPTLWIGVVLLIVVIIWEYMVSD
jgi:hypothetical protein